VGQIPPGFLPCAQHRKASLQTHFCTRLAPAMALQPLRWLMQGPTTGRCFRRKQLTGWASTHRGTALPWPPPKRGARLPSSQDALCCWTLSPAARRLLGAELSRRPRNGLLCCRTRTPAETQFTATVGDLTSFLLWPVLACARGKRLQPESFWVLKPALLIHAGG